ncbi:MAG: ATPase [Clostridia bacterium]|nr:ATPase [Clostridia bacterium]
MDLKKAVIGIELGSTRIKAVLLDETRNIAAQGSFQWENKLVNGVWTYDMDLVHTGLQTCYAELKKDFEENFNMPLDTVGVVGISGMMHGYLPFDKQGKQLAEFRTWRNRITEKSACELSSLFNFNIPQRWSIAHLYQAILNGEEHTKDIAFITTLCGYIHNLLTGQKVLGIGEASGMFPIDSNIYDYNGEMLEKFNNLVSSYGFDWKLKDILPKPLRAGDNAGYLTEEGALFLDPTGTLRAGIPFAPPEGDGDTGMAATNSVRLYTGNVSAGTSDFAMVVVDHQPGAHREIDMITTPSGHPVAMVHCSNCTSDINAWVEMFYEFAQTLGLKPDMGELYTLMFKKALEGEADCGGLLSYNYVSGEGITNLNEGRPLFVRMPDANLNLANFMRTHLMSALATLKIGLDILKSKENVRIDKLYAHGGFFKTPEVGQRLLSAAAESPVSVMKTAGEGGPYGMALLAAYMIDNNGESLEDYLDNTIFSQAESIELMAPKEDIEGFEKFLERYKNSLDVEKTAVDKMR